MKKKLFGRVFNKYYDDQAQMYADGDFRKQMMNGTEIKGLEVSAKGALKISHISNNYSPSVC